MHGRVQADAVVPVAELSELLLEVSQGFSLALKPPPTPAPVAALAPAAGLGLPSYSDALPAVGLQRRLDTVDLCSLNLTF